MVDTQGVAHLGTWEWDIREPTAVWSDELYRIYGLTPETYTPSYEAYLRMVHPDDRGMTLRTHADVRAGTPTSDFRNRYIFLLIALQSALFRIANMCCTTSSILFCCCCC